MADKQQDKALRFAKTIIESLDPPLPIRLWTGEVIKGPDHQDDRPIITLNSPEIIHALVRRPNLNTLIEFWSSGAVDIENGTVFDVAELRLSGGTKAKLRALPKWQLLRDVPSLWWTKPSGTSELGGENPYVSGSDKKAIEHHYDVSNDFYRLFLDESMVYTCAYFKDWSNTIDQAQFDKLDHICRKLQLKPGDRLLDIGCGWGSMLIHAAEHYGVTGHGVSLSEAQTALARELIAAKGLSDKITIEIKSYTDLNMSFNKISSIGMFEAVGIKNYDTYYSAIERLLEPGGIYLHHAITRRNKKARRFGRRTAENRAIVKYIFPGGELDHIGMTLSNLEAHSMEVHDVENLREHYARTCRLWAERLHARMDEAIAEVGKERARLWYFYLAGCSIAFQRGTMQINQTVATKRVRGLSIVPQTRNYLYD